MNVHTDQRSASSSDFKTGSKTTGSGSSAAREGGESHADLETLRADFNALKDTVTNYVSKTSDDALKTAKQATSDVANQIGSTASDVANQIGNTASGIANAASEQAKTFASELERMGRNNPLGAIAGAVLVGVVIGLIGRGRA